MSNVIKLTDRSPQRALETLNRMTGLEFDYWPDSLVSSAQHKHPQPLRFSQQTGTVLALVQPQVH